MLNGTGIPSTFVRYLLDNIAH